MPFFPPPRRLLLAAAAVAALAPAGARAAVGPGRIGPALSITGNGRQLHPIGSLTKLGNFPTAGALTPDGRFLWTVDSGHGKNDVQVTAVASGKIVQTLALPGGYGGVGFTPDGTRAFVSGSPKSGDAPSGPTKGNAGDVVHVFDVDPASGRGTERAPIALPAASGGSGQRNSLPPVTAQYPSVLAVSPDGATVAVALQQSDRVALLPASGGTGRSVQVGRYPAGVAWDRDGRAYVSNALDGTVSVLDAAGTMVVKTIGGLGGFNAQPEGLVADPRTDRMYVAVTQRDAVGVISTKSLSVIKVVSVGRPEALGVQPTSLAVDPEGSTLYVADSGEDAVAAIALTTRPTKAKAGRARTTYRPPSIVAVRGYEAAFRIESRRAAVDRKRARGALARRRATRSHFARVARLTRTLLTTARVRACAGPTRQQAQRFRREVLAALRGPSERPAALRRAQRRLPAVSRCAADGAIAGLKQFELIGKLPVAAYPTAVAVTPDGGRLLWVAGKGLGAGPNPDYTFDGDKRAFGKVTTVYGSYVLDKLLGRLGRLARPTDTQVRAMTNAADAQTKPVDTAAAPAGSPVRKGGPIKHVFYVVRENRTYDQVFGSDPRGDGDPKLELFDDNGKPAPVGGITPNAHALSRSFPLLDHVYANSEVSVDGHLITSGSIANDYTQKATAQNYSRDGKSFDFGLFPISFGPNAFVFDQAARQNVTFRNYGEAAAGTLSLGAQGRPAYPQVAAGFDGAYPNNLFVGCTVPLGPVANLVSCAQDSGSAGTAGTPSAIASRFNEFAVSFAGQLAADAVPAFNYLLLPNDHTNGTKAGAYSPQAEIADNDLGLGQIVDLVSHSKIWDSSAIFVVEDDSQDGADHVDAHRMPGFVISPWAKRGAVVHDRFDQYSFLRTAELLAGIDPLSINDALATPLYAAFDTTPDVEGTRYTAIRPEQSLTEVNGSATPLAALSGALPLAQLDVVPQALLDRVLWASAHGTSSRAPQPGPNASGEEHARAVGALRAIARSGDARAWLRSHTPDQDAGEKDSAPPPSPPPTPAVRAAAAAQARGMLEQMQK